MREDVQHIAGKEWTQTQESLWKDSQECRRHCVKTTQPGGSVNG